MLSRASNGPVLFRTSNGLVLFRTSYCMFVCLSVSSNLSICAFTSLSDTQSDLHCICLADKCLTFPLASLFLRFKVTSKKAMARVSLVLLLVCGILKVSKLWQYLSSQIVTHTNKKTTRIIYATLNNVWTCEGAKYKFSCDYVAIVLARQII